jgi:hypothetical protein
VQLTLTAAESKAIFAGYKQDKKVGLASACYYVACTVWMAASWQMTFYTVIIAFGAFKIQSQAGCFQRSGCGI